METWLPTAAEGLSPPSYRLVNDHDCIPEVVLSIPEVDVGLPTLPPDTTTSPHTSEWPYGSHGSDNHTTPSPVIDKIEKNSTLVNLSTLPPNTTISQHSSRYSTHFIL